MKKKRKFYGKRIKGRGYHICLSVRCVTVNSCDDMVDPLRVAVIGAAGYIGENHTRVCFELPNAEVIYVVDRNVSKAKEIGERYHVKNICSDYKKIDLNKIDATIVATPTPSHAEISLYFLNHGKDVLVEKPMALTLEEADEMIKVASENNCILMNCLTELYSPIVRKLKDVIEGKKIYSIETIRKSKYDPEYEKYGDLPRDLIIHDISICRYTLDEEPYVVFVIGNKYKSKKYEDSVQAILKYGQTTVIHEANRISEKKIRKMILNCDDCEIYVDHLSRKIEIYTSTSIDSEDVKKIYGYGEPLKIQNMEFMECCQTRNEPKANGVEGKKNLEHALKILEKMNRL